MVEQATRGPSFPDRTRELLSNLPRSFSDPVQNDAVWPPLRCGQTAGLRIGRVVGKLVEPSRGLVPRGADRGFGGRYQLAVPLYNKQGSAAEP